MGDNSHGQLGFGHATPFKRIPVNLSRVFLKHRFSQVGSSNNAGFGFNINGKMYSWGKNKHLLLGNE